MPSSRCRTNALFVHLPALFSQILTGDAEVSEHALSVFSVLVWSIELKEKPLKI